MQDRREGLHREEGRAADRLRDRGPAGRLRPGSMSGRERAVTVGVAPGDARRERIAAIAARLGVEVVPGSPHDGRATIGSTVLPPDQGGDGTPDWYLEAALLRALEPRHVLFLCVANSARSQLAEGIARSLAATSGPRGQPIPVRISSAGSEPTAVRPAAVTVLGEMGIDISDQVSTGIDDVEGPVDAVITLCAEEVCPVWLDDAWRLHWGLPDPAAVEGTEEERLAAFRVARDELRRRLNVLFTGRPL